MKPPTVVRFLSLRSAYERLLMLPARVQVNPHNPEEMSVHLLLLFPFFSLTRLYLRRACDVCYRVRLLPFPYLSTAPHPPLFSSQYRPLSAFSDVQKKKMWEQSAPFLPWIPFSQRC